MSCLNSLDDQIVLKFSASKTVLKYDEEELFSYTTGRWLCNDEIRTCLSLESREIDVNCNVPFTKERSRRYVRFDVAALCNIAAKACDAGECVSIKKIAEGSR